MNGIKIKTDYVMKEILNESWFYLLYEHIFEFIILLYSIIDHLNATILLSIFYISWMYHVI